MLKCELVPICRNNDFRRVYAKGKYFVSQDVVVYVLKNRYRQTRIGITASKKIGNAVKRNRSRRIIKEAVRVLLPAMKTGQDYVFVARGKTPYRKSTDMLHSITSLLKKAKMLVNTEQ